ncbi:MAG: hypothetical protein PVJ66_02765 [Gammaproteobacteria bacterium]|jgi:hypothetical protein
MKIYHDKPSGTARAENAGVTVVREHAGIREYRPGLQPALEQGCTVCTVLTAAGG